MFENSCPKAPRLDVTASLRNDVSSMLPPVIVTTYPEPRESTGDIEKNKTRNLSTPNNKTKPRHTTNQHNPYPSTFDTGMWIRAFTLHRGPEVRTFLPESIQKILSMCFTFHVQQRPYAKEVTLFFIRGHKIRLIYKSYYGEKVL